MAEVNAAFALARADLDQSEARALQAQSELQQTIEEYNAKAQPARTDDVERREVECLAILVRSHEAGAAAAAAEAGKAAVDARITWMLPPSAPAPSPRASRPRWNSPRPCCARASMAGASKPFGTLGVW